MSRQIGTVRLCKNSILSFKRIEKNFYHKFLRFFYARSLVLRNCSFAPVQKNQNPSGGFDSPGPQRSTSTKSKIWDVFAQVSFPKSKIWTPPRNDLAGAKIAQIRTKFTFPFLFLWFFRHSKPPLTQRNLCVGWAKIGHVYKGNMCSDFTVFHTEKSTKPNCVQ